MRIFLDFPIEQWILQTDYFFVVKDKYPVTEGHLLIISKRKAVDIFALNDNEQSSLITAISLSKQYLQNTYGETQLALLDIP
jgi:diadenosine tetraphosphate (Ap4A) HIT family hydrolase